MATSDPSNPDNCTDTHESGSNSCCSPVRHRRWVVHPLRTVWYCLWGRGSLGAVFGERATERDGSGVHAAEHFGARARHVALRECSMITMAVTMQRRLLSGAPRVAPVQATRSA